MTTGATNIFLGVGPAIYTDPVLMGEVLATVPPENLGADAWALADAYTPSPPAGIELKKFLQEKVAASTPENWQNTLGALAQKKPWAFERGWLNTKIDFLFEQWLNLKIEETFMVPKEDILEEWLQEIRSHLGPLLKPATYLKVDDEERYREYSALLQALGFTSIEGLDRLTEIEKRAGLAVPRTLPSLNPTNTARVLEFLQKLLDSGYSEEKLNRQDLDTMELMFREARRKISEYEFLKQHAEMKYHVVLVRTSNLNRHKLFLLDATGIPYKEYELDLSQSVFDGKRHLFVRRIWNSKNPLRDHWTAKSAVFQHFVQEKVDALFLGLQDYMEIKSITFLKRGEKEPPHWIHEAIPFTHALSRDDLSEVMRQWEHPYRPLFGLRNSSYEAMRPIQGAQILFLNTWLGLDSQGDIPFTDFFLREIDPNPDFEKWDQYYFGFATDTGRSVDYAIDYTSPDGTRWHHLNAIGVGRTEKARIGAEERDGLLPLEGAQKRFYFSNLMHYVAGPLGFRTSLAVAVINRNRKREGGEKFHGIPQIEATIYELRREQLRLQDLENMDWAGGAISVAREKIAAELGKKKMSEKEYVTWLAKTLGEQFAIMEFFGFDHGIVERVPQLHPGNVALDGSIYDFDSAKLSSDKKAVHERYERTHGVSRNSIWALEKAWRHDPKINSWLGLLLQLADVPFYDILNQAEQEKREALEKSGIDPKAKIREFNVNIWNPYMRSLARNPQAIYHGKRD